MPYRSRQNNNHYHYHNSVEFHQCPSYFCCSSRNRSLFSVAAHILLMKKEKRDNENKWKISREKTRGDGKNPMLRFISIFSSTSIKYSEECLLCKEFKQKNNCCTCYTHTFQNFYSQKCIPSNWYKSLRTIESSYFRAEQNQMKLREKNR